MVPHHPPRTRPSGGEFATAWGNEQFRRPFPHPNTLLGIRRHDDGWAKRDLSPKVTREGRPSAFGIDLVGKYSAFEEIDLEDYLQVRGQAMEAVAAEDPYAAILISMHTYNLLTERADHSTLRPIDRPKMAAFLEGQKKRQEELRHACAQSGAFTSHDVLPATWVENFRLLKPATISPCCPASITQAPQICSTRCLRTMAEPMKSPCTGLPKARSVWPLGPCGNRRSRSRFQVGG